ncbi:hypothetical protein [Streptomyces sp. NPDC051286]|uniref:hypothetical protein n=1 Tax=Streptomyces sp. NPDC051286 TaxID=3365647 RepID=UPI0037969FD9
MKEYHSYLTYTPDGKRLAILGSDHKLRSWDADRGTRVGRAIALGNESLPNTVGFDQGRAVTEEQAGDALRFWDLQKGELVAELHSTLIGRGDAVVSDGRIVVAGEGWYLALDLRGREMAEQLCRAVARDFTEAEKEMLPQGVPEEAPCPEDS